MLKWKAPSSSEASHHKSIISVIHTAYPVGEIESVARKSAEVVPDVRILVDIAAARAPVVSGTGGAPQLAFCAAFWVALYGGKEGTTGAISVYERNILRANS